MKRRENEITDDDLKRESEAMRKKQREEIKKEIEQENQTG